MTIKAHKIVLCALFAALIAAGAFIRIPLPLVPFTMQVFFVMLAGMTLGARGGAAATGIYVILGLAGLPVFTGGGGLGYVLKPSFGYIIGFVLGAGMTGFIMNRKKDPGYLRIILAGLAGVGMIYLIGLPYLALISICFLQTPISFSQLFVFGAALTLPGDIISVVIAAVVAKRLLPAMKLQS